MFYIFDNYTEAYIVNAIISTSMRLNGNVTIQWGEIKQRLDGKFVLQKPENLKDQVSHQIYVDSFLQDKQYTIEEYDPAWFNGEGEI